jgi:cell division protein FtsL
MKSIYIVIVAFVLGIALGCASSQDRAYEAQEKVHEERLRLVEEYKKCVENAGSDKQKLETCDQYLKAAEALK